jgi:phage baseplate assembly protein gpV
VITADGGVTINGPLTVNGDAQVNGDVGVSGQAEAQVDVIGAGISLKGHAHTGVTAGSAVSGPPQ